MAKTATITLGGVDLTVHAFNIDELQQVSEWVAGAQDRSSEVTAMFKIVKLALNRAEPKVADGGAVEASLAEIRAASEIIITLSGMTPANPPEAAPPAS